MWNVPYNFVDHTGNKNVTISCTAQCICLCCPNILSFMFSVQTLFLDDYKKSELTSVLIWKQNKCWKISREIFTCRVRQMTLFWGWQRLMALYQSKSLSVVKMHELPLRFWWRLYYSGCPQWRIQEGVPKGSKCLFYSCHVKSVKADCNMEM